MNMEEQQRTHREICDNPKRPKSHVFALVHSNIRITMSLALVFGYSVCSGILCRRYVKYNVDVEGSVVGLQICVKTWLFEVCGRQQTRIRTGGQGTQSGDCCIIYIFTDLSFGSLQNDDLESFDKSFCLWLHLFTYRWFGKLLHL
jgi:hypothetical protein